MVKKSIFIILFVLFSFSVYAISITDLVAQYSLDNTLLDSTGTGYNLNNTNAIYTTSGKINGAYKLNASQLTPNNFSNLNNWKNLTIALWLNTTQANTGATFEGIIVRRNSGSSPQFGLMRNGNDNWLRFMITDNTATEKVYECQNFSLSSNRNTWTHLTGVWNGTHVYLLVNNALCNVTPVSATSIQSQPTIPILMGNHNSGTPRYYNGVYDEISIWNRTLNQSEINELMNLSYPYTVSQLNINFSSGMYLNGTTQFAFNIPVNVTANTSSGNITNISIYLYNGSGSLINTSSNTFSSNNTFYFVNFTGLNIGNYTYYATAFNSMGNASTETRKNTLDIGPPVITFNFPINNASYNFSNFSINYSISDNFLSKCWYKNITGSNSTPFNCFNYTNNLITILGNWSEGSNNITIYANNTFGKMNSSVVNFFIDTIKPNFNLYSPLNGTRYLNLSKILVNATMSDDNLFAYNITCYNSLGNVEFSNQTTNLGVTAYNLTLNMTLNNTGNKYCVFFVADDHTAEEFNADVQVNNKILGFGEESITVDDEVKITYEEPLVKSVDVSYSIDRVSPILQIDRKQVTQDSVDIEWNITYSGKVFLRESNSKIPGHVVILPDNNLMKGYWYDAEDNMNNSKVTVTIYEDYIKYKVNVSKKELEKTDYVYETKSIGSLNIVNTTFNITIDPSINITFDSYNAYNNSAINFKLNISNGTLVNYSIYDNTTLTLPCNYTNNNTLINYHAQVYSNSYLNNYSYSFDCGNASSLYNLSFWQATLLVSTKSAQTGSYILGTNLLVKNNSINVLQNATNGSSLFYLNNNTIYQINASGGSLVTNSSYFPITSNGNYAYNIYMFSNFTIFLKDEKTLANFNISSPTSIQQYTYCTDSNVFITTINSTNYSFTVGCTYDKVKFIVTYPSDQYYRTFLGTTFNDTSMTNITIFLVDLANTQVIFNTFQLYTLINQYENPKLYFTKNINNVNYVITSDFFNVETKVGTYLMFGEQYNIIMVADNFPATNLGFYTADSAGEKLIRLFNIEINANPTDIWLNNTFYALTDNTTGTDRLKIAYDGVDVFSAELNIYNETNNGMLYYTAILNSNNGIFYYTPNTSIENSTFAIRLNLTDSSGGSYIFSVNRRLDDRTILDIIFKGYISNTFLSWFLAILLATISLMFTTATADIGGLIFLALGGLFMFLGWLLIANITFGLAVMVSVLSFLRNKDRGK
jgi:hypothetical protein